MSSNQLKDPSALVEEGIIVADDTKSDAGSATTAPSVDSGAAPTEDNKEAGPSSRRRCRLIGGGVALLVIAGIIVAAVVVGTCDKDKNSNSTTAVTTQEDSISLGGDEEAPPMFPHDATTTPVEDLPKPFGDIELPLFEEDVLDQYPSRAALEQDLTLAAKDMVNKVILQNLEYAHTYHMTHPHTEAVMGLEDIAVEAALGASTASAAAKQSAQQKVQESLKMTNNQEQDVDEADVLKTDGNHVYAAYGDYLVVWDLQGNLVTQEKMPVPQEESTNPDDLPQEAEDEEEFIRDPFFASMTYAYIESLQLTADHVIAIVGGMGEFQEDSVVYGAKGSHVRVYTKPTADRPTLELVATRDVHGYFFNSRYLADSNTIHIVTGGDFSTFGELIEPLDVYHFEGLNQTEYYYAARLLAEKELIPRFVGRVTDFFLQGNDGQLPTMLKVNQWRTQAQQDAVKDDRKVHPEEHFYGSYDEAFRAYIQVTSFPADDLPTTPMDTPLPVTTTALVGPSSWGFMYATDDSIVLHMSRHDWNAETNHAEETLFLMHLKVNDGGSTQFHSVATLPGYLPGTRAMDIQGDDLRVATTHQKWMPLENVWPVCGDSWYFEDECMNEENWNDCFDVALDCREVAKTGCPYTFECQDDPEEVRDESSTDNTVFVLDLSQPGLMKQHGSVRIGEPHEVIMGVHFGETFSYANTFDQRDPFYVLNLPAGGAPTIAGELKLEGFSSYLQPLNEDATLLVGIGQNVSGQGMDQAPNGLLVTVFDVSNPNTPKALASDMLVDPAKADSYSDAEWDAKSVQYRDGILVIPLSVYQKHNGGSDGEWIEDWETQVVSSNGVVPPEEEEAAEDPSLNFEGFIVLDVSDVAGQGIQEVARINHSQKQGENCHYCSGYLSYRRSFLFEDKSLMTVHDSAVVSTDVSSGNKIWSFNVTMPGEDMSCCY